MIPLIQRGAYLLIAARTTLRSNAFPSEADEVFRMAILIKTSSSGSCASTAMVFMRGAFVAFEEIFEVWLGEFMGDQLVLVNARLESEGGAMVRGYGSNGERCGRASSTSSWDRMPSCAKS